MTWRRWRRYIQITDGLFLTHNFISRAHYLTEELLVHAGINHQLVLYLCFPELDIKEYSMRNSGNRGIEDNKHGVFRGTSAVLPITAVNLSFREFLERMNETLQVRQSEQHLQRIKGNPLQATKKQFTYARESTDPDRSSQTYETPSTNGKFLKELNKACDLGNLDSQRAIEKLSPHGCGPQKGKGVGATQDRARDK